MDDCTKKLYDNEYYTKDSFTEGFADGELEKIQLKPSKLHAQENNNDRAKTMITFWEKVYMKN